MLLSSFVCSLQTCPDTQKYRVLSPRQSGKVSCSSEAWSEGSVRKLVRPRDSSSSKVRPRAAVLDTPTETPAHSQPAADISPEAELARQLEQAAVCRSLAGLDIHAFSGRESNFSAGLSTFVWQQSTLVLQLGKPFVVFILAVLSCNHLMPPPQQPLIIRAHQSPCTACRWKAGRAHLTAWNRLSAIWDGPGAAYSTTGSDAQSQPPFLLHKRPAGSIRAPLYSQRLWTGASAATPNFWPQTVMLNAYP